MPKRKLFLILAILVLAALACDISLPELPSGPDEADAGAVATAVALTLAASEGGGPPEDPPAGPPDDVLLGPPSVLRVAYVDDGDLWLWTEGSAAAELYDDAAYDVGDLRLSDDGQVVAFTMTDGFGFIGFWAINSDGSSLRPLVDAAAVDAMSTDPSALRALPFRWEFVPGSHVLAFNTHLTYDGPGLAIQDDLRLLDADTAALSTLFAPGNAGQFYYSPDGSQIALVTPTALSLINADGSNRRDSVLTYTSVITYSEYQWYPIPRWAPDGSYLRVAIPSPDILDPTGTVEVWHILMDGSAATSLGFTAASAPIFVQVSTISPDMNKLAFLRQVGPPADNTWDIRFVDLSTYVDTWYRAGELTFEVWGLDSSKFVFREGGHLFVGEEGVGPIALPDAGNSMDPAWVDASRVLYLSGSRGAWELRLQAVGGVSVVIASPIGDFIPFDFSH
jgi:hypothetical protein